MLKLVRRYGATMVGVLLGLDPTVIAPPLPKSTEADPEQRSRSTSFSSGRLDASTANERSVRRRLDSNSSRDPLLVDSPVGALSTPVGPHTDEAQYSAAAANRRSGHVSTGSGTGSGRNRVSLSSVQRIFPHYRGSRAVAPSAWWLATQPVRRPQLILPPDFEEIDRRTVNSIVQLWMYVIRLLDSHPPLATDDGIKDSSHEISNLLLRIRVSLARRLTALLDIIVGCLKPEDCELVLQDSSQLFHEFINRWSTGGWHPDLYIPETLMSNLSFGSADAASQ